jgi:hypothetical protein
MNNNYNSSSNTDSGEVPVVMRLKIIRCADEMRATIPNEKKP